MKRRRSELAEGTLEPVPKKARINSKEESSSLSELPSEIWREVVSFCTNPPDQMSLPGDFATFPLLTTCKSISKIVSGLPLWRFMRELKKVPIYKEEWDLKNGFADFHWDNRLVYGKTFLRMLNTINTRVKQRKTDMQLEKHRKVYPELKNLPDDFITFETHLHYQPIEDKNQEGEEISVETTRFTLNFSPSERVTLLFSGSNEDRWCLTSLIVVETSPGLESFKDQEDDTFDWALVAKCAEKFKISEEPFSVLFSDIIDFPFSRYGVYQPYWDHGVLYTTIMDIEREHYKLAADEVPHPAETFLIHVVDSLLGTQFSYNRAITNLIDVVLQSSYKIGAKLFAELFIEQNHLTDKLPQNFIDNLSWRELLWGSERVSVFDIGKTELNSITIRIVSNSESFSVLEGGTVDIASAKKEKYGDSFALTYGTGIDEVQAKCGCEKLSRGLFVSLLLAIGNMDTAETVFADQDLEIPLDFFSPYLATENSNDGTSVTDDSSQEESDAGNCNELDELQEELKGLQEEVTDENKCS